MSVDKTKIGIIRLRGDRTLPLAKQRHDVKAAGAEQILEVTDEVTVAMVIASVRDGDTVWIPALALLAEKRSPKLNPRPAIAFSRRAHALKCRARIIETASGLDSSKPKEWKRMYDAAMTSVMAGRRNLTADAARTIGKLAKKGRRSADFTAAQDELARNIWYNLRDFPKYPDAAKALAKIVDDYGNKYTTHRAFQKFKGRKADIK